MNITRRVPVTQLTPTLTQWMVDLRYNPADPYAVMIVFDTDDGDLPWVVARDLLKTGLRGHAGIGDVRMWPHGDRLIVALSSHDGTAQISLNAIHIRRFLLATYRAVPAGREHVDLDDLIGQLLDDGAA